MNLGTDCGGIRWVVSRDYCDSSFLVINMLRKRRQRRHRHFDNLDDANRPTTGQIAKVVSSHLEAAADNDQR